MNDHEPPRTPNTSVVKFAVPANEEKKNTKKSKASTELCVKCKTAITKKNVYTKCSKLSGNKCDELFCLACLQTETVCGECNGDLKFKPKNKNIKTTLINKLSNTHNFSQYIVNYIPKQVFKEIENCLRFKQEILHYEVQLIAGKIDHKQRDFLCHDLSSKISRIENDVRESIKKVKGAIKVFTDKKINVGCYIKGCSGNLVKTGTAIKCSDCTKTHCGVCYGFHEDSDKHCKLATTTCKICKTISSGDGRNLFCIGCFTFFNVNMEVPHGLEEYYLSFDLASAFVVKASDRGLKKLFDSNFVNNKATVFTYIRKYNEMIKTKNMKLFDSFVENVLCGKLTCSQHDAEVVINSIAQTDVNMRNKIDELCKFLFYGLQMNDEELHRHAININGWFAPVGGDKKGLIGEDMVIKHLPVKTAKPTTEGNTV